MSMQQLNPLLGNQQEYRRRFRAAPQPMFFQYDYAESQQLFKNKYPSSELRSLGGLSGWEWFIDANGLPNIRLRFYNQKSQDPVAPVLAPATYIDQCKMRPPPGVLGFVYSMSSTDLEALEQEQSLKGRQQLYLPIALQTKSTNGTLTTKVILASVFMDMANTRDGSVDLSNKLTSLYWATAIKRMLQMGILWWYVRTIEMKLRGIETSVEPFFINYKDNPVDSPRAARKQKQQQEGQQKKGQEKHKQSSQQPTMTLSQQQKDAMLQQIFQNENVPLEKSSKLTEEQRNVVIARCLRRRQLAMHERQKAEQGRQERSLNSNVGVPEQREDEPHIQIPDQQRNSHTEAILNSVVRKQKVAAQEEESRHLSHRSSMPPPARPARRSSQSGQVQFQVQGRNANTKPSPPAQLNYPQNPNNLKRRAASDFITSDGSLGAKRRKVEGGGGRGRGCASTRNTNGNETENGNETKNKNMNTNERERESESTAPPKPKRKYAGRGRPRKNPIVKPPPATETLAGTRTGNSRDMKQIVGGAGGKVRANGSMSMFSGDYMQYGGGWGSAGANGHMDGSGNGSLKGSGNASLKENKTQLPPHVQQAAQMVDYFQAKVGVDLAGDGRLQ